MKGVRGSQEFFTVFCGVRAAHQGGEQHLGYNTEVLYANTGLLELSFSGSMRR